MAHPPKLGASLLPVQQRIPQCSTGYLCAEVVPHRLTKGYWWWLCGGRRAGSHLPARGNCYSQGNGVSEMAFHFITALDVRKNAWRGGRFTPISTLITYRPHSPGNSGRLIVGTDGK